MLLLTGARCASTSDDVARIAANGAKARKVPGLPHVPATVPEDAIAKRTQSLLDEHFADYDADEARTGVRYACLAVDILDAGQARTTGEAVGKVAGALSPSFALSVRRLADDLRQAKNAGDMTELLTWWGMCQWAG